MCECLGIEVLAGDGSNESSGKLILFKAFFKLLLNNSQLSFGLGYSDISLSACCHLNDAGGSCKLA